MQPETIKIDNQEYVRSDARPKTTGALRIVILQRGWVMVGRYDQQNDKEVVLRNAAIIRVWGTTKGLGEIAEGGPTSKTVLDNCPVVRFHPLTTIATIDCVETKWNR